MPTFVICEDDKEFASRVKFLVDRVMMPFDHDYKVLRFTSYSENLAKVIKTEEPKVYILDVQMPR